MICEYPQGVPLPWRWVRNISYVKDEIKNEKSSKIRCGLAKIAIYNNKKLKNTLGDPMSEENKNETIADAVEKVAEVVEDVVETEEEAVESSVPPLMKLKEEKPAVFFGGIAGILLVLAFFMFSGDDDKVVRQFKQTAVSLGGTYTLRAPNALDGNNVSLKILKIPGQMSAFDNKDDVTCSAPVGTSVTVRGFQDAFGTSQMFVQVEINQEIADCRQGVKGWTLKNNLK